MKKNMTFHKRKIWVVLLCCILMMTGLIGRLVYLMCFRSDYYYKKAKELHEREREIKAARGEYRVFLNLTFGRRMPGWSGMQSGY